MPTDTVRSADMPGDEFQQVLIRLPKEMVDRIDERRGKVGGISRTEWFRRVAEYSLSRPLTTRLTETVDRRL
jgi:metal-responsive CopG/Arc/MetJ family transcriptional regulator